MSLARMAPSIEPLGATTSVNSNAAASKRELASSHEEKATWIDGALVALLMLIALSIGAFHFSGYYASDDRSYVGAIRALVERGSFPLGLASVRLALLIPAALVYYLFGNVSVAIASTLFYHVGLVPLTYWTGRLVSGRAAGLTAATLVATSGILATYSGALFPDVCLAFWMAVWTLVLLVALSRNAPAPLFLGLVLLAGAVNGLMYSVKISGLILAVPGGLAVLFAHRPLTWRSLIYPCLYGLGLLLFFVLETWFFNVFGTNYPGDFGFFYQVKLLAAEKSHLTDLLTRDGATLADRTARAFQLMERWFRDGTIPALSAFAIYLLIPRRSVFLWFSTAFFLLYQVFGTTNFTEYLPPALVDRYFAVVVLPFSIMVSQIAIELPAIFLARLPLLKKSLQFGFATVIVFWGILNASRDSREAGKVVWGGEMTRNLVRAIQLAEAKYPNYPIVVSPYLSSYFKVALAPNTSSNVVFGSTDQSLTPPLVLIQPVGSGYDKELVERLRHAEADINYDDSLSIEEPLSRKLDIRNRFTDYLLDSQEPAGNDQTVNGRGMKLEVFSRKLNAHAAN